MVLEAVPKFIGFIYGLVMIVVIAYLWYSGTWRQKTGKLLLIISAMFGFLIFAPVAPYQFQQLVLRDAQGLGAPLIVGVIGLAIVFLLTLVFGRFFCGYLCPVGTCQEIAYYVPVPKANLRKKNAFMIIRGIIFLIFLLMAFLLSASLLAWFGIKDFFYLVLSVWSGVFIVVLLLSMTFYRPFCRVICPYGVLLSLGAWKSRFRLSRTDACITCKKCEKSCPTDEAKQDDEKAECYLCGRCTDICPVKGALRYTQAKRKV
jgi:ferredoxin-type protein NapH